MPQGWAFFTRSPRESQIQLLKILPDGKLDKVNHYHAHYSNAFGTNRKTTMLLTQLSTVYKQIPDSLFKDSNCNIQYDRYFSTHDSITTDIELKMSLILNIYPVNITSWCRISFLGHGHQNIQ